MTKIVFKMLDITWEVINCDKIDKKDFKLQMEEVVKSCLKTTP